MKFKILKGTELFDKLTALNTKMEECRKAARDLASTYGATGVVTSNQSERVGGADGFEFKSGAPNERWKRVGERFDNYYYPKYGKKFKNEELHKEINALPVVEFDEIREHIGFIPQFVGLTHYRMPAIYFRDDAVLVSVAEEVEYTPLPDMVEILESEYKSIKGKEA